MKHEIYHCCQHPPVKSAVTLHGLVAGGLPCYHY